MLYIIAIYIFNLISSFYQDLNYSRFTTKHGKLSFRLKKGMRRMGPDIFIQTKLNNILFVLTYYMSLFAIEWFVNVYTL